MKKAFTLSEALITLAIIGVLAAILIPVIDNVKPDKDRITYKKAIYSLNTAVSNAMDSAVYSVAANTSKYWKDSKVKDYDFCVAVAASLNTSGRVCCGMPEGEEYEGVKDACGTGFTSSYDNPNFITTDGIRYWGLEDSFNNIGDERTIYVDRKLSDSEYRNLAKKRGGTNYDGAGLKIKVRYDGKIMTDEDSTYENDLIEDSLQVSENKYHQAN